jgi:hypothetical protein
MPYKITRRDDITGAISYGCAPWRVNLSTFPSSDLGFHRGNFLPAGTVLFRIGGSISLEQYGFGFLFVRKQTVHSPKTVDFSMCIIWCICINM